MDECDKLLEVFNSLLKLNRLEHGRENFKKAYRNILSYKWCDWTLYTNFRGKNITIKSQLAQKTLNIDKNLIFQSIVNILDNCYKYSGENTCVSIKGFIKGSSYNLKISDSGNGVNSDNSDKIFERFFREDTSRTQVGNGLGLALVKNIIELHGGSIEAKANIPQGLTMTIKLPLH